MSPAYLPYRDDVERIEPGEADTFARIVEAMVKGGDVTHERYGRAVRTSHAKSHALLIGELRVPPGLPGPLRQGLFGTPRSYPVVVRLSHVPGELLDDRRVSTPRGMAIKVLDVRGPKLGAHDGALTQDFVLDTGTVFQHAGAKSFLVGIAATEAAAPLPQGVKQAVSIVSRATNAALHAVGLDSAKLDFYGHPFRHPLGESYFSQAPLRHGDHVAKMGVLPATDAQRALAGADFEPQDENGLRTAMVDHFRTRGAAFDVCMQLCTSLDRMPVEDATVPWPEEESPYLPVARLVLPAQDAWNEARRLALEEDLSFSPAHCLVAHRPLGSIMRARLAAYAALAAVRRERNGRPAREPRSLDDLGPGFAGLAPSPGGGTVAAATSASASVSASTLAPESLMTDASASSLSSASAGSRALAVVTGASSGIGRELARCCARGGFDLIVAADQPLDDAATELRALGAAVETVEADLATKAGVDRLVAAVAERPVAALCANAGHGLGHAFLDQDFDEVRHVIDTNVTGTIDLVQRLGRGMRARGAGRILITGSIAGFMPGSFQAVYNGTKAFIDSFSFALRNELKDSGVTVTCLMPGVTDTGFFARADMLDTQVGQQKKDDPADVAKTGYDAMMAGEGDVVAGWKNKVQVALANVTPSAVLAEQHRKMAEPGSGDKA